MLDDPGTGSRAVDALVASGIEASRVEVLRGDVAADTFDGTGARHGLGARLRERWRGRGPKLPDYLRQ